MILDIATTLMNINIMDNGKMVFFMIMEFFSSKMARCMMGLLKMEDNTDLEYSILKMELDMWGIGEMVLIMEKV